MAAPEVSFVNQLLVEVARWGVPLVGGLLAVFFTPLVDFIKLRVSRVELRIKQYEEFAKDLSSFIFEAEIQHEFLSEHWAPSHDRAETVKTYNAAITTLRSKELVYLAWAERYWGSGELPAFEAVLQLVRQVDTAVHAFNDEEITKEKLDALRERTSELRTETRALLAPRSSRKMFRAA